MEHHPSLLTAVFSSGDTDLLYKALVEELPAVTYVNDFAAKKLVFVSAQAEKLLGLTAEDLLFGRVKYTDLIDTEHRARVMAEHDEATARGETVVSEYPFNRPDGRVVWIREYQVNVQDADGVSMFQEGFLIDVTEQRSMATRLAEVERFESLGRLAGGVVHDFNNLLAIVRGAAELIERQPSDPKTIKKALGEINSATSRAADMTQQLLAFSRRQVPPDASCDLVKTLKDNEAILKAAAGRRNTLTIEIGEQPILISLGEAQLTRVLINLVVNSREAIGPADGAIRIRTESSDAGVQLIVSDSGPGLAESVRQKIFEPFFTTKEHGSGLGLATVWGIVTAGNGEISVERCDELGGARFGITLPLHAPEVAAVLPSSTVSVAENGKLTALVVDDEPGLRMIVEGFLRPHGWEVHPAENAAAALGLIGSGLIPSLLITDVVMQGMSGIDLARQLRGQHPQLPVLLMSAYPGSADIKELLRQPGISFLEKPFAAEALLNVSRELLGQNGNAA